MLLVALGSSRNSALRTGRPHYRVGGHPASLPPTILLQVIGQPREDHTEHGWRDRV
jgi:hypothetical protein